ncbi:hypothetical protein TrLO_g7287 [Triparma laevis f. longispina]|uniref:Uncharacterized protein n=1 Tax=Triparma laevis f. longispina TaxID=1714387 RepID=A0A9W6ZY40_9STRA|nr:hypothetical protein TrLO_g7287 [Triparma laevis f. longispina]
MSDARAARAAALTEKRARLEEMKAKRAQRAATGGKGPEKKADLDDYIDGLLSKKESPTNKGKNARPSTPNPDSSEIDAKHHSPQPVPPPAPAPAEQKPEMYTKDCQTEITVELDADEVWPQGSTKEDDNEDDDDPAPPTPTTRRRNNSIQPGIIDPSQNRKLSFAAQHRGSFRAPSGIPLSPLSALNEDSMDEMSIPELGEEEKNDIQASDTFMAFMKKSGMLVERALAKPLMDSFLTDMTTVTKESSSIPTISYNTPLMNDNTITSLQWSPWQGHEDILLSGLSGQLGYSEILNLNLFNDSKEKHVKQTPEMTLQSGGPVSCSIWTGATTVVNATLNTLESFDIRVGSLPQMKGRSDHEEGIIAMFRDEGKIKSISTDSMAIWSTDSMSSPQMTIKFKGKVTAVGRDEALGGGEGRLIMGCEDGSIFDVNLVEKNAIRDWKGKHFGWITGVDVCKNRVVTGGVDWWIKLWDIDNVGAPVWERMNGYDMITDVKFGGIGCIAAAGEDTVKFYEHGEIQDKIVFKGGDDVINKFVWGTNNEGKKDRMAIGIGGRVEIAKYEVEGKGKERGVEDW